MEVTAGESEAAPSVGSLDGPGDCLKVRSVLGKHRREDRRDALVAVAEANFVIPLVQTREALPAARNRMLRRSLCHRYVIVRILRVGPLVVTANPIEQLWPALF